MIIALGLLGMVMYRKNEDKTELYLKCMILWILYCYIGVEMLSAADWLTRKNLFVLWGILDAILFLIVVLQHRKYGNLNIAHKLKGVKDRSSGEFLHW